MSIYQLNIAGKDFYIKSQESDIKNLLKHVSESFLGTEYFAIKYNEDSNPVFFKKDKLISIQKVDNVSQSMRIWLLV